jgi:hypothetical protein
VFYGRKKMWRRKTAQRAQARLRFFVARTAEGGEAVTVLLGAGFAFFYTVLFQFLLVVHATNKN